MPSITRNHYLSAIMALGVTAISAVGCDSGGQPAATNSPVPHPTAKTAETIDYVTFSLAAEEAVKQCLKYPLDAQFNPGLLNVADVIQAGSPDTVLVMGTVLAKNDFGGELTHKYRVHIRKDMTVLQVVLGGEIVYIADLAEESESAAPETSRYRMWMDNTLQHTTEAEFVEFKNGKVHLRKRDGKVIEVSPNRLSKDDVKWYRDELKRRKATR